MARKALGKGLDALLGGGGLPSANSSSKTEQNTNEAQSIPPRTTPETKPKTTDRFVVAVEEVPALPEEGVAEIRLEQIIPNEFQPRRHFADENLHELVDSIREQGVLQPVAVRPKKGKGGPAAERVYELIAGERRWRAALEAGCKTIPAVIKNVDDKTSLELALVENIQRENLTPLEEAGAYEQLSSEFALTHEEIARRVGKDRATVTNALRLLKLPKEAQEELENGRITAGHARAILALSSLEDQIELLVEILKNGLSVRQTEQWVLEREGVSKGRQKSRRTNPNDPNIRAIEDELMRLLGTKVRVLKKKKGARISIEAKNADEFQRLMRLLKRAGAAKATTLGPEALGMR